ncbi:apolipoprotein N-acyltransferase [Pseudoduganella rhizocola]|uniref:apolipoprotein N-acyltransferase n=1 Tax=Pseudoduganella rhizocola TaxID=3382643 RepID=UPI0038B6119E
MRLRRAQPGEAPAPARSTRSRMIIAALAGAASVFSFAPFGWWPLQLLCLAVLFYQVLRASSVKASALVGWAFGFGWCLAGVHWLYVALNRFGELAAPPAAISIALLAVFMGGYSALAMGAGAWLRKRFAMPLPAANLLLLPALWAVGEWARGWVFTGFSWASAGYAHNVSPLSGFAPVLGVYGISWLVALSAGALLLLMHRTRAAALALIAVVWGAGFGLQYVQWTHAEGKPLSVRLVQGNIALKAKFDPNHMQSTLRQYQQAVMAAPADLIATPETAVPLFPHQLPAGYLDSFGQFARRSGSSIVLGIPLMDSPSQYSNSVIGLAPTLGPKPYRYDKHHLVPFGEFIPPGFRWFTNLMQIPLGDQTRGAVLQPAFRVKDQRVLPNICYENLFGEEIAEQLAEDAQPATVLLNVSELAWYGESLAIPQHLQISQMRTLETGRPMLSATNSGATVMIDHQGIVKASLPYYQPGVLNTTVQGMGGTTPYILLQNRLILALAALAVIAACLWSKSLQVRAKNR